MVLCCVINKCIIIVIIVNPGLNLKTIIVPTKSIIVTCLIMIYIGSYIIIFTLSVINLAVPYGCEGKCVGEMWCIINQLVQSSHRSVRGFWTNIISPRIQIERTQEHCSGMAFRPDKDLSLFSLIWSASLSHFCGFLIFPGILTPWTRQIALKTTSWRLTWQSGSLASSRSPLERKWMANEGQTSSLWCSTSLNFMRCSATHLSLSQVPQ